MHGSELELIRSGVIFWVVLPAVFALQIVSMRALRLHKGPCRDRFRGGHIQTVARLSLFDMAFWMSCTAMLCFYVSLPTQLGRTLVTAAASEKLEDMDWGELLFLNRLDGTESDYRRFRAIIKTQRVSADILPLSVGQLLMGERWVTIRTLDSPGFEWTIHVTRLGYELAVWDT